ncbi:MAG: hypothetical protein A2Z37_17510 [Chloroflexi bacterium RBG_19FT_COMBO_62_14]|nr:MAG: hypothetical protein A2Z37_17510 [Chloroflexi bacterium RBG_19FT_COMBO_62_14]
MPDHEQDKKAVEKHEEKRDEKAVEEKEWEEKRRRDPLGALIWPIILVWAGLVFLAGNLGLLGRFAVGGLGFESVAGGRLGAWSLVLLGAGVIILMEVAIRIAVPAYRRPVTGSIILAAIFIGLGLGDMTNWGVVWAVLLIILGLSMLVRSSFRSR